MQPKRYLTARKYTLFDCIRLPFAYIPGLTSIITLYHIVQALTPALTIVVMANFIDTASSIIADSQPFSHIYFPLGLLLAIQAYPRLIDFFLNFVTYKIPLKLRATLRLEIFEKRAAVDYQYIESPESLDALSRVIQDPEFEVIYGYYRFANITNMSIRIVSILLIFALQVWYSVPIILVASAPLLLIAKRAGKKAYDAEKECSPYDRRWNYYSYVLNNREGVLERTLFGYSEAIGHKAVENFTVAHNIRRHTQKLNLIRHHTGGIITAVIVFTIIATLIGPVQAGVVSIGTFIALVTAGNSLAPLISWELPWQVKDLARKREFFRDLTTVMNFKETSGGLEFPASPPVDFESLEFRNVRFSYPEMEAIILDGINFTLKKGKLYALVGINGSGKTTITKLITGLYDNFEGDILINGISIREYSQAQLKSLYSVVFQDFAKYPVSLRDNITYGRAANPNCTDAEWQHVLAFIALDDASDKLPKGIDTPLGKVKQDGVDLSGGEWQRVAMARSMMSLAPFKILDEPTASLDPLSESRVYGEFETLSAGKTTLFISHRLGSTKLADEILVIDKGKLIEQGSHAELMMRKGLYAEMFESQKGWYE
ncbi:MAG: ABC transporter ATP-binding protein/permease [Oscillospiraceae bacterium]|nr:ABC transporter ATP-binding protein/permease [Oscillospiraceae bacterium]